MGLIEDIELLTSEIRRESARPERLAELLASYGRLLVKAEEAAAQLRAMAATTSKPPGKSVFKGAMPIRMGGESTKAKRRSMKTPKSRRGA